MKQTNNDLLTLVGHWEKKISSLNLKNKQDLVQFELEARSLIEMVEEEIEFHEVFPNESILFAFENLKNRVKSLLIVFQKQFENKAETRSFTKFLASNSELTPELKMILHALLGSCFIGYKNSYLENKRRIQLKISYLLMLSFGLKESDLKAIRMADIQLLMSHCNIQLNNRNLRLNDISIGYLKNIPGIYDLILFNNLNDFLWDLSNHKMVELLNKNIQCLLLKENLPSMRCHDLRRMVLMHLLANPVYLFKSNKELSQLFGLTPAYLGKFREKSTL